MIINSHKQAQANIYNIESIVEILKKIIINPVNDIAIVICVSWVSFSILCNIKCKYYFKDIGLGVPQIRTIIILGLLLIIAIIGLMVFNHSYLDKDDLFTKYRIGIIVLVVLAHIILIYREYKDISIQYKNEQLRIRRRNGLGNLFGCLLFGSGSYKT